MRVIRVTVALAMIALLEWDLSVSVQSPLLAQSQPILQVSPTSLSFQGLAGGLPPDPQALTISNTGGELLEWHASTDVEWIILGASGGKLSGGREIQLLVWVETEGLEAGDYRGTITLEAPGAQGSPAIISVQLTMEPVAQRPAFFKVVDITVEPSELIVRTPATIRATIENRGGVRGTDRVSLYVDRAFKSSRTISLEPKSKGSVAFTHTFFSAGSHHVEIRTSDDARAVTVEVRPVFPETGALLYEDDFSDPSSGWPVYADEYVESAYQDGKYSILVMQGEWWAAPPINEPYRDFIAEVDLRQVSGTRQDHYGIVFRLSQDGYYRFGISGAGEYSLFTVRDGRWEALIDWTSSQAIRPEGNSNHLKVIAKGSQISLFANGEFLVSIDDTSFIQGNIGLYAAKSGTINTHVQFDNFRIYSIRQ